MLAMLEYADERKDYENCGNESSKAPFGDAEEHRALLSNRKRS